MLAGVKLLGRKKDKPPAEDAEGPADSDGVVKGVRHHRPEGRADAEAGCARVAAAPSRLHR